MRPRKMPPVDVPAGSKFCFKCNLVLPLLAFATDAKQYDGKKFDCRRCDSAAAYARKVRKRDRERVHLPEALAMDRPWSAHVA